MEKVMLAIVRGITGLVSAYFLYFGAACLLVALLLYMAHAISLRLAARKTAAAPPEPFRQLPNKR
jgi:ABC-type arginine transport system permease subunit